MPLCPNRYHAIQSSRSEVHCDPSPSRVESGLIKNRSFACDPLYPIYPVFPTNMNQNRPAVADRPAASSPRSWMTGMPILIVLVGLLTLPGCGGDEATTPSEPAVVTPPQPRSELTLPESDTTEPEAAPGEAPGELVLPPGENSSAQRERHRTGWRRHRNAESNRCTTGRLGRPVGSEDRVRHLGRNRTGCHHQWTDHGGRFLVTFL